MIEILRNKEIKTYAVFFLVISTIGTFVCFLKGREAGFTALISFSLLFVANLIFIVWKYRQISKLSGYLRRISGGEYSLDVRDNTEGDLSILKSEIYKVTITLSEQAELLKKDKLYLANSISDISHQLKTPLTSMSLMMDLLEDRNLPPDKRAEFTQNIQRQLERLKWLVSSLLKISKIDAGAVEFKKEQINVGELIKSSMTHLIIPMEIKGQTLRIKGEDKVHFIGDFKWSLEAFANIIKNCIEHTPQGGVIDIGFWETSLYTRIDIEDSGEGIGKEDLPYIFKRFYKGKNANDDSVGIGLAMAKSILESQGASIEVRSGENQGTQFAIKVYKGVL